MLKFLVEEICEIRFAGCNAHDAMIFMGLDELDLSWLQGRTELKVMWLEFRRCPVADCSC